MRPGEDEKDREEHMARARFRQKNRGEQIDGEGGERHEKIGAREVIDGRIDGANDDIRGERDGRGETAVAGGRGEAFRGFEKAAQRGEADDAVRGQGVEQLHAADARLHGGDPEGEECDEEVRHWGTGADR